jgi:lipopolysaccharide export system protein LptC
MSARWYDRIAALISIALLAVLAAVSFYLAEKARRLDVPITKRVINSDPDYFIEGFSMTKTAPDGKPRFRLNATHAKHRPDTDGFELTQPVAISLDPGNAITRISAKHGTTTNGRERTELDGDVVIDRRDKKSGDVLLIETAQLTLLTEQDLAQSDQLVVITQGASQIRGTGMVLNTVTRELRVLADVKVTLPARAN